MSSNAPPLISVVVPLYNKADFIVRALQSIQRQSYRAFEVLVIDDGSRDNGSDKVLALGDPTIKLIRQSNGGVSVARNTGIGLARGDLIAFLDADDEYLPGYLETIADLTKVCPDSGVFAAGYRRSWPDGRTKDELLAGHAGNKVVLISNFYELWRRSSFTHTNSIVIRRETLALLSPWFPVGERLGEDQDLWFRVSEITSIAYSNQVQTIYHMDVQGSACSVEGRVLELLPCYQRLAQRIATMKISGARRRSARKLLACHYINVARALSESGRQREAWNLLGNPKSLYQPMYWVRSMLTMLFRSWRRS